MAKKKGGGKKGGKKGAALPTTLAVGGVLMGNNPPSNFPLYKNPPVHRPVPVLMPSSPGRHRMPPAPPRLPIAVVRAASNGDVPAITGWLAASGSIDATWDSPMDHNVRGFTLLMLACLRGHEPLVVLLLQRKASLDMQDGHGATALIISTANGRHSIVAMLLQAGARTDLKARKGGTALDFAQARGYDVIVQLIRTHEAASAGTKADTLPDVIAGAAKLGKVDEVLEWLACGGLVDAPNPAEMGATALMLACANGREALVAKLLELGASTDAKRADGSTPLMIAALGAHRGVVRQLVMHRRPPTFNYDAITKPIAGVSEYALEFRASGRWRSAPTLTPAGGSAVAGRTSLYQESALTILGTLSGSVPG